MQMKLLSLILVAGVSLVSSENQDAYDVSLLQAGLAVQQPEDDDEGDDAEQADVESDGIEVKFNKKEKSPCRLQFDVMKDDKRFSVETDELNIAVVKAEGNPEERMLYRDGIGHGEEIMAFKGEFFVKAEMNKDTDNDERVAALLQAGITETELVHVGKGWNSNGTAALLQHQASLEEGHTQKMLSAAVQAMLQDEIAPLVAQTSPLLGRKGGITVAEYPCAKSFHLYAQILSRGAAGKAGGKGDAAEGKKAKGKKKAALIETKEHQNATEEAAQCSTNKFGIDFCNSWCNTNGYWGCGDGTLEGADTRNTDNSDYTCSCAGCNGCGEESGCQEVTDDLGWSRRRRSSPWNPNCPRDPYIACGSTSLGLCSEVFTIMTDDQQGGCADYMSGCTGDSYCRCNRGCEYHDWWCLSDCSGWGMSSNQCWTMSFGGWDDCQQCVGSDSAGDNNDRRRRFWS